MIEQPDQPSLTDEEQLRRLFARRLPPAELSAQASETLLLQVLGEVQRVFIFDAPESPKVGWIEHLRSWLGGLRPGQFLLLAGGAAIALMLLFVGVSRLAPRPLTAVATVSGGNAMVLRAHNNSFRVYGDGDILKIQKGDHILTETGAVTVTHFPNQVAVVEPGAHVEFTQLDDADGGTQVELYVFDGIVRSDIDEKLGENDRYVVNAPGLSVTARGTEFSVEAISEVETVVTTVSGEVEVKMGNDTAAVGPGEELDAKAGSRLFVSRVDSRHTAKGPPLLVVVKAAEGLKIYPVPRESAAALGRIVQDNAFQVVEQDPTGEWYRICCIEGKSGWVRVPVAKTND